MENNVPNLDCEDELSLRAFWMKHQRGRLYRELFPMGGTGTRKACADLANYAANKSTAIHCRLNGNITSAMEYEQICDSIYSKLPAFAKSW